MKFKLGMNVSIKFKETPLQRYMCADERYVNQLITKNNNRFVIDDMVKTKNDIEYWMGNYKDVPIRVVGLVNGGGMWVPSSFAIIFNTSFVVKNPKNKPQE